MKHDIRKSVGRACAEWRCEHGYTQQNMADKAGVSRAMISQFENGRCYSEVCLFAYIVNVSAYNYIMKTVEWRGHNG